MHPVRISVINRSFFIARNSCGSRAIASECSFFGGECCRENVGTPDVGADAVSCRVTISVASGRAETIDSFRLYSAMIFSFFVFFGIPGSEVSIASIRTWFEAYHSFISLVNRKEPQKAIDKNLLTP
ncbi:MAG: hypothetical protein UW52_C0023G0020 [Candidatus Gottesmanbacteria bacterium GW2011_GWA1_44_24b]|uniref:Uncharacterized protein n=1 Tax=Candidatus Gottesmanbacteria bacterium GW2011_GWA1_44_24b TaxID=1618437 RepID=A0A0G1KW76_9BACT|nr:MAG: hypothetical protein UW52_C0023G0020 [Candidatus Gottesmanbacteria bacterium GW2011_GWA1_44_24b]